MLYRDSGNCLVARGPCLVELVPEQLRLLGHAAEEVHPVRDDDDIRISFFVHLHGSTSSQLHLILL
jgi:hypothetical protein